MVNPQQNKPGSKQKPVFDKSNPVLEAFSTYSEELDDKHDRHERLIKLSRDITIQSKKIIFFLQTIDASKNNKEKVLEEAKIRLDKLAVTNFKTIATELKGRDQYQYLRAFTFGLQEYIEAYTFYDYIKGNRVSNWNDIQQKLSFSDDEDVHLYVPAADHILGLLDLTGEVMRFCINSLGSGNTEGCVTACKFLQTMNTLFLGVSFQSRDFSSKLFVLKQSLLKCEMVCYNIRVRGGEATKLGAQGLFSNVLEGRETKDDDEGFY